MKKIQCAKCKLDYPANAPYYRKCPHPKVQENFGKYICVYCCRKCNHHKKTVGVPGEECELINARLSVYDKGVREGRRKLQKSRQTCENNRKSTREGV